MNSGTRELIVEDRSALLPGQLCVPELARGVVVFAHGSGSSRLSPRNIQVAESLQRYGLGTFLFDLLTSEESQERHNIFDIRLLSRRLLLALKLLREQEDLVSLPFGFFGASTGAAAALFAATEFGSNVDAVVCRGGRPDLVGARIREVSAPTLLLVGAFDQAVVQMNRRAFSEMRNAKLSIVPGAGHLFEEPGALEAVEEEAATWFLKHFDHRSARRTA